MFSNGIHLEQDLVRRGGSDDSDFIEKILRQGRASAHDMRIVGIDDVKYASLLPVPLTTQHQNCADIGAIVIATMLQRLDKPDLPTRDILLQTHTVVRKSCGTHLSHNKSVR